MPAAGAAGRFAESARTRGWAVRSRLVKVQLALFVVIALLGIVFVGARYVRLDNLMGFGQYTVDARFPTGGGIFPNAEVTYRGVPVAASGR